MPAHHLQFSTVNQCSLIGLPVYESISKEQFPTTRLAGDHTFNVSTLICVPILLTRLQVIKKMGGMKGVPIHEALYSTINEYEEAHSSAMVPTKALSYVSEVYKGIKTSLEKTEQEPTQVIYCDQPEGASFKNKFIAKIYFLQSNSHFMKVSTIHFVYSIDLSGPSWHRLFMPASRTPFISLACY
jgi:hypothetical protein